MEVLQLTSSEDYFTEVLRPNMEAFFGAPSRFSTAVNLATSLFHFHEWLVRDFEVELIARYALRPGKDGRYPGSFWAAVEASEPKFRYIRDVANASKHVEIGIKGKARPSTGMTHMANTHIISLSVPYGTGRYGAGRYGGGPSVILNDRDQQISFDDCARAVFLAWKALLESLTGQTYAAWP